MKYIKNLLLSAFTFSLLLGASLPAKAGKSFTDTEMNEIESNLEQRRYQGDLYVLANDLRHDFKNDRALSLAEKIFTHLIETRDSKEDKAIYLRNIAKIYDNRGKNDWKKKKSLLLKAIEYDPNNCGTLMCLGTSYNTEKNKRDKARTYFLKVLDLPNLKPIHKAEAYIALGNSRVPEQLEYYKKAQEIAKEQRDNNLLFQALMGRGHAKDPEARNCFKDARDVAEQMNRKDLQIKALCGIALSYKAEKRDDDALHYFDRALALNPKGKELEKINRNRNQVVSFLERKRGDESDRRKMNDRSSQNRKRTDFNDIRERDSDYKQSKSKKVSDEDTARYSKSSSDDSYTQKKRKEGDYEDEVRARSSKKDKGFSSHAYEEKPSSGVRKRGREEKDRGY